MKVILAILAILVLILAGVILADMIQWKDPKKGFSGPREYTRWDRIQCSGNC